MAKAVRFTEKGETFDVPVAEAAQLADRLEQESDSGTQSAGGLSALIRDIIESGREPDRDVQLDGFEPTALANAISHMIGSGSSRPCAHSAARPHPRAIAASLR